MNFLINSPAVGRDLRHQPRPAGLRDGARRPRSSTRCSQQIKDYEASIADRLGDAPPVPIIGYGSLEEKFRQLGEELGFGTITVDDAVSQFFSEMDVVLNQ